MKKILMLFLGMLVAGLSFIGCKKDKDVDLENHFQIAEVKYAVDSLEMEYCGTATNGYWYWIDLVSPEVTIDDNGFWGNQGKIMCFEVVSSSGDGIASGDYIFNNTMDPPAFSINGADYCTTWNKNLESDWIEVTSGTLSVTRDGNNYEMIFAGKDAANNTVKAYYKGVGTVYDFTAVKSTRLNK